MRSELLKRGKSVRAANDDQVGRALKVGGGEGGTNDDVTAWPVCRMTAAETREIDGWVDNQGGGGASHVWCQSTYSRLGVISLMKS